MLLRIAERVKQLRTIVPQIDVFEVSTWTQLGGLNEVGVEGDVEGLDAVKAHLSDLETLNPNEGLAISYSQQDRRLDFTGAAYGVEELKSINWAPVARYDSADLTAILLPLTPIISLSLAIFTSRARCGALRCR